MFVGATRQTHSPERRHTAVGWEDTFHLVLVIIFFCLRLFLFGMDACFCLFLFGVVLIVVFIGLCLILISLDICFCLFLLGIDV